MSENEEIQRLNRQKEIGEKLSQIYSHLQHQYMIQLKTNGMFYGQFDLSIKVNDGVPVHATVNGISVKLSGEKVDKPQGRHQNRRK